MYELSRAGLEAGGIFFTRTKRQKLTKTKTIRRLKNKVNNTPNMRELKKRSHSEQC